MFFLPAAERAVRLATIATVLTLSSVPVAHAQKQSPAALQAAQEIVAATGATALFNPLIAGVIEQAKVLFLQQDPSLSRDANEIAAKMRADLAPRLSELNDAVAKMYATHFTEQELKDLLAFYKSPVGKKLVVQQPEIADGSLKFAQDWANKLSDEVVEKMRLELKKKGHAL